MSEGDGRKLVMNWGDRTVSIEILKGNPYHLPDKGNAIMSVRHILGERIETMLGPSAEPVYGASLNECVPSYRPHAWLTVKELDVLQKGE